MAGTRDFGNLRVWKHVWVPFFKNDVLKMQPLPGSKIPLLAIYKIISHIWEDRSRKVNNDEPGLRFFHGNFRPVISQAVRKPCFSTSIPGGQNPRFPDTAGAGGQTLRSQPDPSPNAPRDEILPQGKPSLLTIHLSTCQ